MYKITKQSLSLLLRKIQLPLHKGALETQHLCGFLQNKTASKETAFGTLKRTLTSDLPLRRRPLYTTELSGRILYNSNFWEGVC